MKIHNKIASFSIIFLFGLGLVQPLAAVEAEPIFSHGFESPRAQILSVDYPVIAHGGRLQISGINLDLVVQIELGGVVLDDYTIEDPTTIIINPVLDEYQLAIRGLLWRLPAAILHRSMLPSFT